ncbi:hypothetical protein G5B46_06815 [Caulobacter sp. 602-2]|uniref:Cell envelope biogenesis protein TolA n=1 Tax=Caulobacter sp. 602-2 TaxID=2710887 RepID=A0A6G4QUZ8_9CAUL|nr:hypothetical protein [Caulobacter sp. 602-2]NGM49313.1 hypothetical protein [Caulobacter sp. 602-2]
MAKAPAKRRLKVYRAQFGFHDSVVAAPNQAAALAAWGTRQNLFAEGAASLVTDATVVEAALAHPGTPLRRAVGSTRGYSLEPDLPEVPEAPRAKPKLKVVEKAAPSAPRPKPDRRALDKAEKVLARINQRRIDDEADIARRRTALEAEDEASKARWREDRRKAEKAVVAARRAFTDAGGEA